MAYTIERNIPLPKGHLGGRSKSHLREVIEALNVTESVLIDDKSPAAVRKLTIRIRAWTGKRYSCWKTPEGVRVWRIG